VIKIGETLDHINQFRDDKEQNFGEEE